MRVVLSVLVNNLPHSRHSLLKHILFQSNLFWRLLTLLLLLLFFLFLPLAFHSAASVFPNLRHHPHIVVIEQLIQVRVEFSHVELFYQPNYIRRVSQIQPLSRLKACVFETFKSHSSFFEMLFKGKFVIEKHRLEEEPDAVRKEKAGRRCHHYQLDDVFRKFHFALQVEGAQLRDEKFEVHAELRREIGIYTHFLKILDCFPVMRVESSEQSEWIFGSTA